MGELVLSVFHPQKQSEKIDTSLEFNVLYIKEQKQYLGKRK